MPPKRIRKNRLFLNRSDSDMQVKIISELKRKIRGCLIINSSPAAGDVDSLAKVSINKLTRIASIAYCAMKLCHIFSQFVSTYPFGTSFFILFASLANSSIVSVSALLIGSISISSRSERIAALSIP